MYEDDKIIQGFVGVRNEYIEGIFVFDEMQSHGIGKILLDYIKDKKSQITVKRISEECQGNVFLPKRRVYYLV
nr:GNAT family N-acetyltransferase [Anaerostipes caccae]